VEEHRGQGERALANPHRHQVLLGAHHDPPERDALLAFHRLEEQPVGA
jgi:hypothetical protein